MKTKNFWIVCTMCALVSLASCQKDEFEEQKVELGNAKTLVDVNPFHEFDKILWKNKDFFLQLDKLEAYYAKQALPLRPITRGDIEPYKDPNNLIDRRINVVEEAAMSLLETLDFSDEEIQALSNNSRKTFKDLKKEEVLGIAMTAYTIYGLLTEEPSSKFLYAGYYKDFHPYSMAMTRSLRFEDAVACIGKVLLIHEVRSILTAGTVKVLMSHSGIKQVIIRVAAKLGIRAFSGIGLAISAAELAYCLYEKAHEPKYDCEYIEIIPEWWHPSCEFTPSEARNLKNVVINHDYNIIYTEVPLENLNDQKVVIRMLSESLDILDYEREGVTEKVP